MRVISVLLEITPLDRYSQCPCGNLRSFLCYTMEKLDCGIGWCKMDAHSTNFGGKNAHTVILISLRDQASNWLERLPVGSISIWENLTTRFLAQFFPSGRTAKLRNDILMFQQHQGESFSEAWTRKMKGKTYNLLPRGPVYDAILKKKITRNEDIGGNFEIPCNIGGIADDVLVDVAGYVYPVDFMILDIKEDENMSFILGTPFLTKAKVVIKFDKGTITLRSGKSKISFHRIPESLGKIEKGIKNDIEPIAPTITVNKLVLEWEERIKLHQEKEVEFDQ
uniref:Zinc finger, CCHC-type n=1 Tax=Tanacetum cinerariifolium TaxID=118510 RepID=A0A699ILG2_TANCI|nr:zinc finger, CCHC-type [Tanacetum cinerariifolium]